MPRIGRSRRRRFGALVLAASIAAVGVASSDFAGAATAAPELEANRITTGAVRVEWGLASAPKPRVLEIQRRTDDGSWSTARAIKGARRRGGWTDKAAPAAKVYYRARLVVDGRAGAWSEVVHAWPVAPPTTAPPTSAPPTSTPTTVPPGTPAPPYPIGRIWDDCPDEWEREVLGLIQNQRGGLPRHRRDARLDLAAQWHTNWMINYWMANQKLAHHRLVTRVEAAGYVGWSMLGENLAGVQERGDPNERVVQNWMNSPAHRDAIMSPFFDDVGVSCMQSPGWRWWTMEFGTGP